MEIDCPGDVSFRPTLVKPAVKTAPRRPRKELWGALEGLTILPSDSDIPLYDVPTVWK